MNPPKLEGFPDLNSKLVQLLDTNPLKSFSDTQKTMAMFLFLILFLQILNGTSADLCPGFYQDSCSEADKIARNVMKKALIREPRSLASGMRFQFHDCLVNDARFDSEFLTPFYQGHKTTDVLTSNFQGQHLLALNADQTSEFDKEKSAGVYDINLKIYLRIRFKLGVFKIGKFKPKINCDLKVPWTTNGTSSGVFETTKCDYGY